jgi:hypothetical protein
MTTTFRSHTTREFDPDLKRWIVIRKDPPVVTVQANGYLPTGVDLS